MKLLMVAAMLLTTSAVASPTASLQTVGQGQMHWMFWKLYDIRLYSADGRYQQDLYPLALSIRYARDIPVDKLVEATVDEWERMGQTWNPAWKQLMLDIWPSVSEGDEITLVASTPELARFYYNSRKIGEIRDAAFNRAFLDIWLSEQTREPELRKQLLGISDA